MYKTIQINLLFSTFEGEEVLPWPVSSESHGLIRWLVWLFYLEGVEGEVVLPWSGFR